MRDRSEEIATFFLDNGARLERSVTRRVRASAAVVEDACAHAWFQLVRRPDIALDRTGYAWLHRVAIHEAWSLSRFERRTVAFSESYTDEPQAAQVVKLA